MHNPLFYKNEQKVPQKLKKKKKMSIKICYNLNANADYS